MENKTIAVDLGLPNGILWGDRNIGADKPEGFGGHFAWGMLETQKIYTKEAYKYYPNKQYMNLGEDITGSRYDVARERLGTPWRLPTLKEAKDFLSKRYCIWEPEVINGIEGFRVTGKKNGNSLFMPFGGMMIDEKYCYENCEGSYWTGTFKEGNACGFTIFHSPYDPWGTRTNFKSEYFGVCVRPVCSKKELI